jgi:hypothetical protein
MSNTVTGNENIVFQTNNKNSFSNKQQKLTSTIYLFLRHMIPLSSYLAKNNVSFFRHIASP